MADYAAIANAIEQDRLKALANERGNAAVARKRMLEAQAGRSATIAADAAAQQKAADLHRADLLASGGDYGGAAAIQAKYTPSPAASSGGSYGSGNFNSARANYGAGSASSPASTFNSAKANYSGGTPKYVAPRNNSSSNNTGQRRTTTHTTGTTGTTATTEPTPAAVGVQVQPQAAPTYIPPQVAQPGFSIVRQPTPCELGQGGCQSPEDVSSNVAQWQLDPNTPLSLRDKLWESNFMRQASQSATGARQASAAEQYDAGLMNPEFNNMVQANMTQNNMPYNVAVAETRRQLAGSEYAKNLLGTPNIIRAVDSAAGVDQAVSAVANAPYQFQYANNSAGYVPSVQAWNPNDGSFTVNNRQVVNTGLSGPSVPIALAQSIAPGIQAGWLPASLANIAAVGTAAQNIGKQNAQFGQKLAEQNLNNQGDIQRQLLVNQGQQETARLKAQLKAAPPPVPAPRAVVK